MGGGEGDSFRKIDRRPSPYCNESIAREGTIGLDTLSHGPLGGIRRRPVEHAESDRTPELRRHAVDQTCRPDPLVSHDERTTKTDALAFLPEQSYGTEIELDRRDVGNDCDRAFSRLVMIFALTPIGSAPGRLPAGLGRHGLNTKSLPSRTSCGMGGRSAKTPGCLSMTFRMGFGSMCLFTSKVALMKPSRCRRSWALWRAP
jgi:hypothetical protein